VFAEHEANTVNIQVKAIREQEERRVAADGRASKMA
jgi:hypothetical protein